MHNAAPPRVHAVHLKTIFVQRVLTSRALLMARSSTNMVLGDITNTASTAASKARASSKEHSKEMENGDDSCEKWCADAAPFVTPVAFGGDGATADATAAPAAPPTPAAPTAVTGGAAHAAARAQAAARAMLQPQPQQAQPQQATQAAQAATTLPPMQPPPPTHPTAAAAAAAVPRLQLGANASLLGEHLRQRLEEAAPLLPAVIDELRMMVRLDVDLDLDPELDLDLTVDGRPAVFEPSLAVEGQPAVLEPSFGVDGQGIAMGVGGGGVAPSAASTTAAQQQPQQRTAAVRNAASAGPSPPPLPPAEAPAVATYGFRPLSAPRHLLHQQQSTRTAHRRPATTAGAGAGSGSGRPTTACRPFQLGAARRSQSHAQAQARGGGGVAPRAAARLLLPRLLRAQLGAKLTALDLKAALAELRSYREPPDAVRRVVVGVLCLLGRCGRGAIWMTARQHLRPELLRAMMQFEPTAHHVAADTAADATDGTSSAAAGATAEAWVESAAATAGLTTEEVRRRGSVAVQAMLQWLEVNRLARSASLASGADGSK